MVCDFFQRLHGPFLKKKRVHELEFSTGSRVVSLPCAEDTIRGFSGVHMLVIDEAARVPDDLYRAVRPMLAVSRRPAGLPVHPLRQARLLLRRLGQRRRRLDAHRGARLANLAASPRNSWRRNAVASANRGFARNTTAPSRPWKVWSTPISPGVWYIRELSASESAARSKDERGPPLKPGRSPLLRATGSLAATEVPQGRPVGGIDFGFRNPFAAIWGVLDRDGILWLTGEHYARQKPLSHHARHLPREVRWYADPSGATEISELRCAGFAVSRRQQRPAPRHRRRHRPPGKRDPANPRRPLPEPPRRGRPLPLGVPSARNAGRRRRWMRTTTPWRRCAIW